MAAAPASHQAREVLTALKEILRRAQEVEQEIVTLADQSDNVTRRNVAVAVAAVWRVSAELLIAIATADAAPSVGQQESDEKLLAIAGLVNGYHNDGTKLTAAETLAQIADVLGEPSQAAAPAWRSMESAPKDGRAILVAAVINVGAGQGNYIVTESQHCGPDDGGYWAGFMNDDATPTHWMPLPPGPIRGDTR